MSKPVPSRRRRLTADLSAIAIAVGVMFMARSSLADHYHVPTGSMMPTVHIGDRIVVNKAAYAFRVPFTDVALASFGGPARGEVVVLSSPDDGTTLLTRVVGVPGDHVAVRRGRLVYGGEMVPVARSTTGMTELLGEHPHPLRLNAGGGPDFGPVELGPDEYLVMGDNRGNSRDGRMFGTVPASALRGRVLGVYLSEGRLTWRELASAD